MYFEGERGVLFPKEVLTCFVRSASSWSLLFVLDSSESRLI